MGKFTVRYQRDERHGVHHVDEPSPLPDGNEGVLPPVQGVHGIRQNPPHRRPYFFFHVEEDLFSGKKSVAGSLYPKRLQKIAQKDQGQEHGVHVKFPVGPGRRQMIRPEDVAPVKGGGYSYEDHDSRHIGQKRHDNVKGALVYLERGVRMDGDQIGGYPQDHETVKNEGVDESDPFMATDFPLEKDRSEKTAPIEFSAKEVAPLFPMA